MGSSTPRVQRLRKRRKEGILMCTMIEVGAGGIELLVGNGLLGPNEKNNKAAIQRAVEDAAGAVVHWPRLTDQGSLTTMLRPPLGKV